MTETTAFVVASHANVALQWGAMDKAKSKLVRDEESFDSKTATDAMLKAYEGCHYQDNDDKIWDVYGAPAAEWCRMYSQGSIQEWDLPTVAQLKVMHENRHKINDCLKTMGGWKLTNGWYWSSIEKDDRYARCVDMRDGDVNYDYKSNPNGVRAVSAFQL